MSMWCCCAVMKMKYIVLFTSLWFMPRWTMALFLFHEQSSKKVFSKQVLISYTINNRLKVIFASLLWYGRCAHLISPRSKPLGFLAPPTANNRRIFCEAAVLCMRGACNGLRNRCTWKRIGTFSRVNRSFTLCICTLTLIWRFDGGTIIKPLRRMNRRMPSEGVPLRLEWRQRAWGCSNFDHMAD